MITEDGNESILEEAQRLTHGTRNVDYGHPLDDYTRTAGIVSAMLAHKLMSPLTAHEMALVMVCVKLSREQNAPKRDNRTDGAGYFWVADQCLQEAKRRVVRGDTAEIQSAPALGSPADAAGLVYGPMKPLTFKDFPHAGEAPQIAKAAWLCQVDTCARPLGHFGECIP